jgi:hypothetical protein
MYILPNIKDIKDILTANKEIKTQKSRRAVSSAHSFTSKIQVQFDQ